MPTELELLDELLDESKTGSIDDTIKIFPNEAQLDPNKTSGRKHRILLKNIVTRIKDWVDAALSKKADIDPETGKVSVEQLPDLSSEAWEKWANNVNYPPNFPKVLLYEVEAGADTIRIPVVRTGATIPAGQFPVPFFTDQTQQYYQLVQSDKLRAWKSGFNHFYTGCILYESGFVAIYTAAGNRMLGGITLRQEVTNNAASYQVIYDSQQSGGGSKLTGYVVQGTTRAITEADTLLMALGILEARANQAQPLQGTGQSTTSPMSQKAVTDELRSRDLQIGSLDANQKTLKIYKHTNFGGF